MKSADPKSLASGEKFSGPRFIDPRVLMAIRPLELRARIVMEGLWTGLHRSPYQGFSVEFTEYRQYSPGDDLRYLDWRLYARSDRYYLKKFEDETNLRCYFLVDCSRSMSYGSSHYSKTDYARTLAATLAYFFFLQRDATGVLTFDSEVREFLPARQRTGHLRRLMLALDRSGPGKSTSLAAPLETIAALVKKRGMIILISDLLAPLEGLERNLGLLRALGHEISVFQVLDQAEIDFPFAHPILIEDLENGKELYLDPARAKADYLRQFNEHQEKLQAIFKRLGMAHWKFITNEPMEKALLSFLRSRFQQDRNPRRT
jgi:uncharacterized protein (DUF58 family)